MLDHLDANDEVVFALDWLGQTPNGAISSNVRSNLRYCVVRDIAPPRLDAAIPQCLDKETVSATSIEHTTWAE
jgi:hypothetical protein